MTPDKMIHMANQIALFFEASPHDEAVAGIANHLKKFWERRMLTQLRAHIESGGVGLRKIVVEATSLLK
jgi:formate dehydrogenase subunit delta